MTAGLSLMELSMIYHNIGKSTPEEEIISKNGLEKTVLWPLENSITQPSLKSN